MLSHIYQMLPIVIFYLLVVLLWNNRIVHWFVVLFQDSLWNDCNCFVFLINLALL